MKTTNTTTEKLINRNELSSKQGATTWDVLLDGEIIGSVHGQTRLEAEMTIAVWKMKNLTIAPTAYKGN